jgi:RecJ-like exonuclease
MPRYPGDDYDYANDPFYVATGEPPLEIVCPCCSGEGFIGERTTKKCPRCKGRGMVENTEKVGTTYRRLSPV